MPSTGRRLLLRRQPQEIGHAGRGRGRFARDLRHAAVRSEHARAGMPEDEGDVVGLKHEVDRDHHRAEAHQRVAQRDEAVGVARERRDPVAAPDPPRREPRRQPLGGRVELAVGPARRAAGEPEPPRRSLGAAAQGVGERLPPETGIHGPSLKVARFMGRVAATVGRRIDAVNQALEAAGAAASGQPEKRGTLVRSTRPSRRARNSPAARTPSGHEVAAQRVYETRGATRRTTGARRQRTPAPTSPAPRIIIVHVAGSGMAPFPTPGLNSRL